LQHLLRIGLPIRREPQHAAGAQPARRAVHELRRNQAPFLMAFLVPRVREEHQYLIEGLFSDDDPHHLDGVATNHPQVGQLGLFGPQQ